MEKEFRNHHFMVRLSANRVESERVDRELAQSNRSLPVNAKMEEYGTASTSGKGRYIFVVKVIIAAGHCCGGEVEIKERTDVGVM